MRINRASLIPALAIVAFMSLDASSQVRSDSPYPVVTGKAYKFEKITDGVYYATATGAMVTGSNNVAIVGDRDVLVIDTGTSPAAARAFQEDLKAITNKPVRYVVNTHFHYDHTDGNQVYAGKADIIAHEYVTFRNRLPAKATRHGRTRCNNSSPWRNRAGSSSRRSSRLRPT